MFKKKTAEKVLISKEEYSESSKRSVGYEYLGKWYSGYKYKCFKCQKKSVYSAIEQKKHTKIEKNICGLNQYSVLSVGKTKESLGLGITKWKACTA